MCLENFEKFEQIEKENPVTGYRAWLLPIKDVNILRSLHMDFYWKDVIEGPHEVSDKNSGIYSYNNYNNYNYIAGIIKQYGKVAIHKEGYRSEFAKIDTLFNIREFDAKGPKEFLDWIKLFNERINETAKRYEAKVTSWQDLKDQFIE